MDRAGGGRPCGEAGMSLARLDARSWRRRRRRPAMGLSASVLARGDNFRFRFPAPFSFSSGLWFAVLLSAPPHPFRISVRAFSNQLQLPHSVFF